MLEFIMDTEEGQAMVEKETIADAWTPLNSNASDSKLDERIRKHEK